MKYLVVYVLIISLVTGAPLSEDGKATILSSENNNDGLGNYEFSFETSNGILRRETGTLVNPGQPDEHIEVRGEFSYTDPEGKLVVIRYTADENGYNIELPSTLTIPTIFEALPASAVATLLG